MPAATVNNIGGASRKRGRRNEGVAAGYDSDQADELVDVRQASSGLRSEPVSLPFPSLSPDSSPNPNLADMQCAAEETPSCLGARQRPQEACTA